MPKTTKSYRKNLQGHSECECCARCGKFMPDAALFVVTVQGEYPVGSDCAEAVKAEGFEVVEG
jgi:hypothetical protein